MSTLSMQAAPSLGHPMEKLLDNYMMAERGGGAEEGGGGAAFMVEDGGMISYTGVFMDDEEDLDDDASASSTEAEVMAHLHAALGGSVSSINASGSTSSSSSSGSTSTSGGTVSAAPEGDSKGEGWKMALLEGLEDFLKVEGAVPAGAAGSGGSRRFSFDLSNLDMQTLEQLAAGATSGPSSRRGSFSLTMLEAEGLMAKGPPPVGTATPLPSSGPRGNGNGSGLPLGNTRVKQEVSLDTASRSNSVSSLGTTASNGTSASSTDISDPVSNTSTATTTSKSKAVKKEPTTTSASQATPRPQPKKGASPTGAITGGASSLRTTSSGLISAASLLPTPQTPHKAILAPSTPTTITTTSSNGNANAITMNSPNGNGGTLVLPIIPKDGIARIGIYTLEERKVRVARFQAKRGRRVWRKKIKYDCRKKLADNRPRVKGRFVRRDEEIDIIVGGAVAAAQAAAADGVADGGSSALLTQLMDLDELLED